ncbi:MAG TPA: hypothetical protein VIX12_00495 [Candidatus Binataceae bacterium]
MLLPEGEYRYEVRRGTELIATEHESLRGGKIAGERRIADGQNRHEVEAALDENGQIVRLSLSYVRGPFTRSASYEADGDFLRGSVSALAGRNVVSAKLGRLREIDADLVLFRALIIAHMRQRGQTRWTGRVATVDSNTLVAASSKQSCRVKSDDGKVWLYEPRMGDFEEIEIDAEGRILRRRDSRGIETKLIAALP